MNAPELTRAVTDALDLPLRAAVDRLEDPLREMARHHFGWDDSSGVPPSRHKGAILAYLCRRQRPGAGVGPGHDGSGRGDRPAPRVPHP